jgi:hypothetical protein
MDHRELPPHGELSVHVEPLIFDAGFLDEGPSLLLKDPLSLGLHEEPPNLLGRQPLTGDRHDVLEKLPVNVCSRVQTFLWSCASRQGCCIIVGSVSATGSCSSLVTLRFASTSNCMSMRKDSAISA